MSHEILWEKFKDKEFREEFVAAQLKRGIPMQVRALLDQQGINQTELSERSGLSQGVVSRCQNMQYGNLTINTIIKLAAGFDVAFIGKFVPFSELEEWFLSEPPVVPTFAQEDKKRADNAGQGTFTEYAELSRSIQKFRPMPQRDGLGQIRNSHEISSRIAILGVNKEDPIGGPLPDMTNQTTTPSILSIPIPINQIQQGGMAQ